MTYQNVIYDTWEHSLYQTSKDQVYQYYFVCKCKIESFLSRKKLQAVDKVSMLMVISEGS